MAADSTSYCYGQNRIHHLKQLRLFPFLLGRVRLELEINSFCKEHNGQGKSYTRGKKVNFIVFRWLLVNSQIDGFTAIKSKDENEYRGFLLKIRFCMDLAVSKKGKSGQYNTKIHRYFFCGEMYCWDYNTKRIQVVYFHPIAYIFPLLREIYGCTGGIT